MKTMCTYQGRRKGGVHTKGGDIGRAAPPFSFCCFQRPAASMRALKSSFCKCRKPNSARSTTSINRSQQEMSTHHCTVIVGARRVGTGTGAGVCEKWLTACCNVCVPDSVWELEPSDLQVKQQAACLSPCPLHRCCYHCTH